MSRVFLTLTSIFTLVTCDWDLAVTTRESVLLLSDQGETVGYAGHGLTSMSSLAYDPLLSHLYFADRTHPNASIFRLQVSKDGRRASMPQPLVVKMPSRVHSLSFDAESTSLFWTSGRKEIYTAVIGQEPVEAVLLHRFEDETPAAIVVEPCERYIYWTNINLSTPSIERSLLDGSGRLSVVSEDLHMPVALAISQTERKLYWIDERSGNSQYRLERSNLDGSLREVILVSQDHQPSSMTVGSTYIYWSVNEPTSGYIWRLELGSLFSASGGGQLEMATPQLVANITDRRPSAIVTAHLYTNLDPHVCHNIITLTKSVPKVVREPLVEEACVHGTMAMQGGCLCEPGYTGRQCETWLCQNYCLNEGRCQWERGRVGCSCQNGYSGDRCQLSPCQNYCHHNGTCTLAQDGTPLCSCPSSRTGARCHLTLDLCSKACSLGLGPSSGCKCDEEAGSLLQLLPAAPRYLGPWQVGCIAASSLAGLFLILSLVLAFKTAALRRRPRLKRTYRVSAPRGSAPPTAAQPQNQLCEIAIENCCNMNICETPCYEPDLRPSGGKSKKEEKRGLLGEMEVEPTEPGQLF